ncbi:hypothetical protein Sjap_026183 [Stephania japonica]|uniref:Uncharacterized protein n=1 Tax=Stephania japonica TaxID=461633 RepID=A0AAP0E7H8_9MAGN
MAVKQNWSYTVRSGYRKAMQLKFQPTNNGSFDVRTWWNYLWAMDVPLKLCLFLASFPQHSSYKCQSP